MATTHDTTWRDLLHEGLTRHRRQRETNQNPTYDPDDDAHQITLPDDCYEMNIDDVLLGISSVWNPLRTEGDIYAFAGPDVFDEGLRAKIETGYLDRGIGVVGGQNEFIMPLFFPPPSYQDRDLPTKYATGDRGRAENLEQFKEATVTNRSNRKDKRTRKGRNNRKAKEASHECTIGHFVLAVARKVCRTSNTIHIEIRDTLPGYIPSPTIGLYAQEIATTCGWIAGTDTLGQPQILVDASNNPIVPTIINIDVPSQPYASNACGLFVILFAWAYMLGIEIHPNSRRRGGGDGSNALRDGIEVVNLALAGHMDSRTIQAYLNVYGYSVPQDVNDPNDHVRLRVDAVRMNGDRLKRSLHDQREMDSMDELTTDVGFHPLNPANTSNPVWSSPVILPDSKVSDTLDGLSLEEPRTDIPEGSIQFLMAIAEPGTTHQQVVRVLHDLNDDWELAIEVLRV